MRNVSRKTYSNQPVEAASLLEACNDETSFFFATPTQTFLGQGIQETLSIPNGAIARHDLPSQAMALLKQQSLKQQSNGGLPQAALVGAVPFDDSATVHLFVPNQLHQAGPLKNIEPIKSEASDQSQCTLRMVPEPSKYMHGVEQALEHIRQSELLKVVLSRSLELSFPQSIDLSGLLRNLADCNRHGYTYLINLSKSQQIAPKKQLVAEKQLAVEKQILSAQPLAAQSESVFHKLIGASPELLVRRRGMRLEANPLAGSAPRSGDRLIDQQRADALMKSDKDRHEHAVVVEAVADTLRPFCHNLEVPSVPKIVQTDSMIHLSTHLRGTLKDSETCALSLALALHPTPAVCGSPVTSAYSVIHAIEPFARRYFTGLVGWVDNQGDGEWAVTIRCGEAKGRRLRLYAGAGIVAGSTAAKELAETSAKFRTMLKALELEHMLEVRM